MAYGITCKNKSLSGTLKRINELEKVLSKQEQHYAKRAIKGITRNSSFSLFFSSTIPVKATFDFSTFRYIDVLRIENVEYMTLLINQYLINKIGEKSNINIELRFLRNESLIGKIIPTKRFGRDFYQFYCSINQYN
ncbi:MAG: hypothetical protein E7311_03390 [Clostridiales bacterium]|nr:hypothetical protein [Clostridiales bacterium]